MDHSPLPPWLSDSQERYGKKRSSFLYTAEETFQAPMCEGREEFEIFQSPTVDVISHIFSRRGLSSPKSGGCYYSGEMRMFFTSRVHVHLQGDSPGRGGELRFFEESK